MKGGMITSINELDLNDITFEKCIGNTERL